MPSAWRIMVACGLSGCLVLGLSACAAKAGAKRSRAAEQIADATPVPTVPPAAPTPVAEAAPLPTRPIGKQIKATKGHPIGPIVTFFGAARADGSVVPPESVDKAGVPTYRSGVGAGFIIVVEAKPGASGFEPGRRVFAYVANDPNSRPDLEIESTHDLGNGSPEVCDRRRPNIGGVPGIKPPSFADTQRVSDAINDFGCRFETFIESSSSCTLSGSGDYSFVNKESMTQFCRLVARAYGFPVGETLLSVRIRDSEGNPGPVKQLRVIRPPEQKKDGGTHAK